MTTVKIEDFKGENRARSRELTPVNVATTAVDCKLTNGALRAFRGRRRVHHSPVTGTRTIYRFGAQAGGDRQASISRVFRFDAALVQIDSPDHPLAVGDRVYIGGTGTPLDDATYPVFSVQPDMFRLAYTPPVASIIDAGYWVKHNGHWFTWDAVVHCERGPIGTDAEERTYFTGVGKPQMTTTDIAITGNGPYPAASYDLGVPAPTTRPSVALVLPVGEITHIYGWQTHAPPTQPLYATLTNYTALTNNDVIKITGISSGPLRLNNRPLRIRRYYGDDTVQGPDVFMLIDPDTGEAVTRLNLNPYPAGAGGDWALDVARVAPVDKESRFYAQTYVSALGEEGPPSTPSVHLRWSPGTSVAVTDLATGPASGNYNLDRKRLYRLATVDGQGAYQFVAELPIAQTSFTDDVDGVDLGEVLQSLSWDPPPTNLKQLIALPNGVLAGIAGHQLCLSAPNQPHAWPALYRANANDPLVALGNFGTGIVACSRAAVYLASGANPEGLILEDLHLAQGCCAAASMVSLGLAGVAFASLDGLVLVGPQGPSIVTETWFDRDAWLLMYPRTMRAYLHDRRFFAFYGNTDTAQQRGLILDPAPNGMGLTFLEFYADGALSDPLSDRLFVVVDDYIEAFDNDASDREPYLWEKRLRDLSLPVNFACAEVLAADYDDLTLTIYADTVLKFTKTITGKAPFRLPAGFTTRDYRARLTGTSTVTKLLLGEDVDELLG